MFFSQTRGSTLALKYFYLGKVVKNSWMRDLDDVDVKHVKNIQKIYVPCSGKRRHNPLPDDKILDWSKLKKIADDILKCI